MLMTVHCSTSQDCWSIGTFPLASWYLDCADRSTRTVSVARVSSMDSVRVVESLLSNATRRNFLFNKANILAGVLRVIHERVSLFAQ
jgi:hypothetical protein